MFQCDENLTLGDAFGLNPDAYSELDVSNLPVSIRVTNRLLQKNIKTVAELLRVTTAFLMGINGFGCNCIEQVYSYLDTLEKADPATLKKPIKEGENKPLLSRFKDMITVGDFSFIKEDSLSSEEIHALEKYKTAYDVLGEDLVFDCVCYPDKIYPIINALSEFANRCERLDKLEKLLYQIPEFRRNNCAKHYINAFAHDEIEKNNLYNCFLSTDDNLNTICSSIDADDYKMVRLAEQFLDWCTFDIKNDVFQIFSEIYSSARIQTIIEGRAQNRTMNDIGEQLKLSRERIRQIESKAKRIFYMKIGKKKILSKLFADSNGKRIITYENLESFCEKNADAFVFFLKDLEGNIYNYDCQLDAFVVAEDDLSLKIQDYIDSLPNVLHKEKIPEILKVAFEEYDLDIECVEKVFYRTYKQTGDVFHKTRLSLTSIYEETLKNHYPKGIHVYDEKEIDLLRKIITQEYGDIALPENNRAIVARISSIGTLAGRGIYIAKRKNWISKELEYKLIDFIESNESSVLFIGTIFAEFEDELKEEEIDNRYFLQGVLRELFGDRLYFRRDYVSRDKGLTTIYSSIISFIRQHQYPVKKEEIQAKFKGITEIVISMATSDSDILNFFGEYLHGSRLIIHEDERQYLHDYLNKCLSDNEAHHIKDIYAVLIEEKPEVFSRNAAKAPYCMFSVLEYLFRDQFQFSRPYMAKNDVEIELPIEQLQEMIYSKEDFLLSDIRAFTRDNHIPIYSILDFINSLNDKFLIKNIDAIISINEAGLNESIANQIEIIIKEEICETTPIRNLLCISKFPVINCDWSEWLIYSTLFKWSNSLDVALSSSQLRQSIPLVAPRGKMDATAFKDVAATPVKVKIDNLDNIDDLISDLITEEMLEDI